MSKKVSGQSKTDIPTHVRNQQVSGTSVPTHAQKFLGGAVDKRAIIVCFLAGFITGTVVGEWNLRRR